jgi:hypothetical protein
MLYKKICWGAFIFCLVVSSSCRKKEPCIDGTPILNFVSFSDTQTESIILRKYSKGSDFNSLVDSTEWTKTNSTYEKSGDTLRILNLMGGDYALDIDFDYEVYMPFANKLFKINNIVIEQSEMNAGLKYFDRNYCLNPIKSYTLNGQVINTAAYIFYLKN